MQPHKNPHSARGRYVEYLRLKQDLLQYHLEELSGIASGELCNIEAGQNITIETEFKIARAFNIERWQLAKVPPDIDKRLPWMKRKRHELNHRAAAIRKDKGIKGKIPLEMWVKELERIRK